MQQSTREGSLLQGLGPKPPPVEQKSPPQLADEITQVSEKLESLSFDSQDAINLRDIFLKNEKDLDRTIMANAFVEQCEKPVVPSGSQRASCALGDLCLKAHGKEPRRPPFDQEYTEIRYQPTMCEAAELSSGT